jgi:hypothetical protein
MKIWGCAVWSITTKCSKLHLRMPSSDISDFSDSDLEEGVPVSLDCGACKKKFKSTDRGCDQDERTCSTCTKKAHRLLMSAFLVEPGKTKPVEAAVSSSVISNPANEVADKDIGNDADGNGVGIGDAGKDSDDTQKAQKNTGNVASSTMSQGDQTPSISVESETCFNLTINEDEESDSQRQGSESSGSDQSGDEGNVTKKKGRQRRKKTVGNFDLDVDDLLVDEASIECNCGGQIRTLCRKTFRMDSGATIRLFCDLELLDELPLLYSYFVLSAHVNPTLKRSVRGLRVVQDQNGKKWVVLCVFRSKCPNPRYDIIILDPAETDLTKAVMRICGLTNFFKWYKYVPDETFDNAYAIQMLKEYLLNKSDDKGRPLVYDNTKGPNKDEMGRPMSDGYDPANPSTVVKDAMSPAASKRVSTKRVDLFAEEQSENGRIKMPRRGRRGPAANKVKASAKQKQKVSECICMDLLSCLIQVVFVDADGNDLHDDDDHTTDGWEDPKPFIDEAAEWKRKYDELLVQQRATPPTPAAQCTAPVAAPVAASKDHAVAEEKKERKKGPRKSAPEPAEEVQQRGNKKQRLSLKQVKAIQRQTVRMERYHQSEMDSAARDTLALAGVDSDGDY